MPPDFVEDPLQDVFGVVVGDEPSEVSEHHRAERSVDVVDRTVLAGGVPHSETGDGALLHCRFFRSLSKGTFGPSGVSGHPPAGVRSRSMAR